MANTTLNPADKTTGTALSNGSLTATSVDGAINGARAVHSKTAGKYYFEGTWGTITYIRDCIGLCKAGYLFADLGSAASGATGNCVLNQFGTAIVDGGNPGLSFGTITNGTVVCVAVDLTGQRAWFRLGAAGNWNTSGTANPATGIAGLAIPNLGGAVAAYPVVSVSNSDAITVNFGNSAFVGAVPAGFTSGFPDVVAAVAQARAAILA